MSVSHNHRRKTIRQFKKKHGKGWHKQFAEHCTAIRKAQDGPLLGSVQDIIEAHGISPATGGLAGTEPVPVSP